MKEERILLNILPLDLVYLLLFQFFSRREVGSLIGESFKMLTGLLIVAEWKRGGEGVN